MEEWNINQMTPFDQHVSTQPLQLMKLLIPYLPPKIQRVFAIYIKFLEFQYTLSFFQSFHKKAHSTQDMIQDLKPYLPSSAAESLDNFLNLLSMMEVFQTMQNSSDENSDWNPMSMMTSMLGPDTQEMFEMYQTMFSQDNNESIKGEEKNVRLDE